MSILFQEVMFQLGIKQVKSTVHHPQSQGAVERFNQTLKSMLRVYCLQENKKWDEGLPLRLFAVRESFLSDCIDQIGHVQYISKLDLLKGYWQVPLTEGTKKISAFMTPDGLYQYMVKPLEMKNAPYTYQ